MVSQPATINQLVSQAVIRHQAKKDWLNHKVNGQWQPVSAMALLQRIQRVTLGLYDLGIRPGDRVAILSENRLEWNVADIGILALGAISVPIYSTQTPSQVEYILRDSGSRLMFISTKSQLERVGEAVDRAPELERLISFDPARNGRENVLSLTELEGRGARAFDQQAELFDQLREAVCSTDLATLIYTSGTTGEPKGVILTHGNITSNVLSVCNVLNYVMEDVVLSFLPFSHIFERTAFFGYLHQGVKIYYAESLEQMPQNIKEVRPTVICGVPRMLEKIYERIRLLAQDASPRRRKLLEWAIDVGKRYAERAANHQPVHPFLRLQYDIAYHLVLRHWRPRMGFDRLRYFISGGAACPPDLAYIFFGAGIEILQGYGLTETSPGATLNLPGANEIGTSGKPLPGVEISIAGDGEVLVRGPNVMRGYFHREEENRRDLTADGWFQTGDIGYLDEEGYLVITDRKKDLIKTSGGKYVAPQLIEGRIKMSPYVAEAVVVGNDRKFAVALIVPNLDMLVKLADQEHIPYQDTSDLLKQSRIIGLFDEIVETLNAELSRHERIKKFALLADPFSVGGGELTPTMKVRRRIVEQRYEHVIEKLYHD